MLRKSIRDHPKEGRKESAANPLLLPVHMQQVWSSLSSAVVVIFCNTCSQKKEKFCRGGLPKEGQRSSSAGHLVRGGACQQISTHRTCEQTQQEWHRKHSKMTASMKQQRSLSAWDRQTHLWAQDEHLHVQVPKPSPVQGSLATSHSDGTGNSAGPSKSTCVSSAQDCHGSSGHYARVHPSSLPMMGLPEELPHQVCATKSCYGTSCSHHAE